MRKIYVLAGLISAYIITIGCGEAPGCSPGGGSDDSDCPVACARCNDGSDYNGTLCSAACSGNGGVSFYYEKCNACE